MALEITGKLIKVLPEVTGEGKNGTWRKQEFVIETLDATYPKKICMELWGDKTFILQTFAEGDTLKVSFDVESRPYQDRWFTSVKAFLVRREGEGNAQGQNANTNTNTQTRQNAPIPQDPYPDDLLNNGGGADELPF
ncbi:MAG: DUF3127 domain-containing protein [Bacteroidetes bacterium]|nr:MAG: DUF3127 domain-containing protein [Bacteroidota bacterium]